MKIMMLRSRREQRAGAAEARREARELERALAESAAQADSEVGWAIVGRRGRAIKKGPVALAAASVAPEAASVTAPSPAPALDAAAWPSLASDDVAVPGAGRGGGHGRGGAGSRRAARPCPCGRSPRTGPDAHGIRRETPRRGDGGRPGAGAPGPVAVADERGRLRWTARRADAGSVGGRPGPRRAEAAPREEPGRRVPASRGAHGPGA